MYNIIQTIFCTRNVIFFQDENNFSPELSFKVSNAQLVPRYVNMTNVFSTGEYLHLKPPSSFSITVNNWGSPDVIVKFEIGLWVDQNLAVEKLTLHTGIIQPPRRIEISDTFNYKDSVLEFMGYTCVGVPMTHTIYLSFWDVVLFMKNQGGQLAETLKLMSSERIPAFELQSSHDVKIYNGVNTFLSRKSVCLQVHTPNYINLQDIKNRQEKFVDYPAFVFHSGCFVFMLLDDILLKFKSVQRNVLFHQITLIST